MPEPPIWIDNCVVQTPSYEPALTLTQISAATAAARRIAADPVSVRRNSRSGVSRLRAQAVLPDRTPEEALACSGSGWPRGTSAVDTVTETNHPARAREDRPRDADPSTGVTWRGSISEHRVQLTSEEQTHGRYRTTCLT